MILQDDLEGSIEDIKVSFIHIDDLLFFAVKESNVSMMNIFYPMKFCSSILDENGFTFMNRTGHRSIQSQVSAIFNRLRICRVYTQAGTSP